jgi:hypothetical protein
VLSLGADSIKVEHQDGHERVFAQRSGAGFRVANFRKGSADARELRQNLYAAAKKPFRIAAGGQVSIVQVRVDDSFGEDAFEVTLRPAPQPDPSIAPKFTSKQGHYLAFIHYYSKIHRQAPSESDLQRYFQVSPPSVHDMIKTLERNGLIKRVPGEARSIRALVRPEHLPALD